MPATLYTFGASVWAAAAELAIHELGYPDVDFKVVNLLEGQNFEGTFLQKNPAGTLPTFEADGKTFTNTTDVVRYIASHAAKTLPEPTPEQAKLIRIIHEEQYDPNFALLMVRNEEELKAASAGIPKAFVAGRQATLNRLSASPSAHSGFYKAKSEGNSGLLAIYEGRVPPANFFAASQAHFENLRELIYGILPEHLQAENAEADFHVVAWFTRIATTSGATGANDVITAVEKRFDATLSSSVKSYLEKWVAKDSWSKVYSGGLH